MANSSRLRYWNHLLAATAILLLGLNCNHNSGDSAVDEADNSTDVADESLIGATDTTLGAGALRPSLKILAPGTRLAAAATDLGGLRRLDDGSFTMYRYNLTTFQLTGTVPNIQAKAKPCYPARPVTRPAGYSFLSELPGVAAMDTVAADLGNGTPSLLTVGKVAGALTVATSNADFTFKSQTNYPAGNNPAGVLAAELNNDNRRDIVVINAGLAPVTGSVLVFTSKGDGTLNSPTTIPFNGYPTSGAIFDFNSDGKRDLAVTVMNQNQFTASLFIMLGNGNGTFQTAVPYDISLFARSVAVADINGDSRADLVVAEANSVDILFGNGNGTFQARTSVAPADLNPGFVATGDFNKDGKQDLALADLESGRVGVWFGSGSGTFPTRKLYASLSGVIPIMVMDFDWDGNLDIVRAGGHPDMIVPSTYYIGVIYNTASNNAFCAAPAYKAGVRPNGQLADVNGDGRLDMLTTSNLGGLDVSLGQAGGAFAAAVNFPAPAGAATGSIVTGDFNRDGKLDALVSTPNASPNMAFYPGNGNGTFGAATQFAGGPQPYFMAAADFNGDNRLDLAIGQGTDQMPTNLNSIAVVMGNGDGTFQAPVTVSACNNPFQVQTADFNADQKTDILVTCGPPVSASETNGILLLSGAGNGTFTASPKTSLSARAYSATLADMNGDGKQDVIVSVQDRLAVLAGQGNGSFAPPVYRDATSGYLLPLDFDGDGRRDILLAGFSNFALYRGQGDGTLLKGRQFSAGGQVVQGFAGDLTGDGKPDLIALNQNYGVQPDGGSSFAVLINTSEVPGAAITSPTAGATLSGTSVTFQWETIAGATYKLDIGTTLGGTNIFTATTNATSQAVTNLPANGSTIYARLTTTVGGSARPPRDYLYAAATAAQAAAISSPTAGSTLSGPAVTFTWNAIAGATYRLDAGNSAGATDIFTATTSNTSQLVSGLPLDGRTIHVKLTTTVNGNAGTNSYTYKAASSAVAILTSPVNGSVLPGASATFVWTAATGATQYKLDIGGTAGAADLFTIITQALSQPVTTLPVDGRLLYVRLTTYLNGVIQTPVDYTFRAAGGGLRFVSLPPCRIMETRSDYNFEGRTGAFGPPFLNTAETRTMNVPASNVCTVPATAKAYVVNVTLIPRGSVDFVTVFPAGDPRPNVYTVRSPDGNIVANSAIVRAGANGGISVYASNPADMIIDISGYYTDNAALSNLAYYPMTPCRVIDTRIDYRAPAGPFGPPTMAKDQTRSFRFPAGPYCTVPNGAAAYSVTVTVVPPKALPFLTTWPTGTARPNVSTINSFIGRVLANSVIVPASANGSIDVYTFDASDFIIDINGYYAPDDGVNGLFYFPVTQCRAADSTQYNDDTARSIAIPSASGCSGIPSTAKGYALNITAVPGGSPMPFITAYPTGQARPNASILNAFEGQTVTNSAIVPAGPGGSVDVYAFRRTNIIVELNGYFGR